MNTIWDTEADRIQKGDNLRDISPLNDKTKKDDNGYTHYIFRKILFNNLWYEIPNDELELFKNFINGGSRAYPSDGSVPCDIVAKEARIILNKIVEISNNPNHQYYNDAREAFKNGKFALVRGTMKLYLGKYTTRDWRRKRFTDDIDFWIFKVHLFEYTLKQTGWVKNKKTREWEKRVQWVNLFANKKRENVIIAANDLNQLLDFGAGRYLEGSNLKEIFNKKLKRGHDVDLSDLINVILVNNGINGKHKEEWLNAWTSFEEAANTRNTRITSNIISLFRYMLAIADHLEKVSKSIRKHHNLILDKNQYSDKELTRICRTSIHWLEHLSTQGPDATRRMIHDFLIEQGKIKPQHSQNLKNFAHKLLNLLNSKYKHLKIIFEVEN